MKKNKRKGMTLAELCIVMAVVAIVSLSVASFVTMASGRGTAAATKLDAMGDLEDVESIVESWISEAVKDSENVISIVAAVDADSNEIKVKTPTNDEEKISLAGKTLQVSFPGGDEDIYYPTKSIIGLKFSRAFFTEEGTLVTDDGTNAQIGEAVNNPLYYCTVTYQYRNGIVTKEQTYTFCVNPRVG